MLDIDKKPEDRLREMHEGGLLTDSELSFAQLHIGAPWDFSLKLYEDYQKQRKGRISLTDFEDAKRWYLADAERRANQGKPRRKSPNGFGGWPLMGAGWLAMLLVGYLVASQLGGDKVYETMGTAFEGIAAAAFLVGIIIILRAPRGDRRAGIGCIGAIVVVLVAGGIGTAIKNVPGNRKAEAKSTAEDVAEAERMGLGLSSYRKAKEASSDAWSACRREVVNTGGSDAMNPDIVPNYSWSVSDGVIHISGRDMKFRMPGYELPAPYECDYDMATGVATHKR